MGVTSSDWRNARTTSSTSASFTPWASARSLARWMVGPSAIGSENGTPSSMMSAPAATHRCRTSRVTARVGNPTVMYGISALRPAARSRSKVATMRGFIGTASELDAGPLGHGVHVLVSPAGQIDQDELVGRHLRRDAHGPGDRVRRLQRRDDALDAAAVVECGERLVVVDDDVACPAGVLEPCMLGTDAGVVETGRHRMGLDDLAVVVLQQVGAVAVQHARRAPVERRGMAARGDALAPGLDAHELDAGLVDVRMEDADGVRAAAHAGNDDE